MQKINFQNLPNTTTPLNATNLNAIQTNVENAINDLEGKAFKEQTYLQQDFNNYTTAGSYMINTTNLSNIPIAAPGVLMVWVGHYSDYNTTYIGQLYISNVGSYTRFRDTGSTSWTGWQKIDNQENYTTSEQKIGTWVDGKPLYRKVILGTLVDGDLLVDLTSLNIYEMIRVDGFCGNQRPLNFYFSGYSVSTRFTGGYMYIFASTPYANDNFKMIIEYTKTTD